MENNLFKTKLLKKVIPFALTMIMAGGIAIAPLHVFANPNVDTNNAHINRVAPKNVVFDMLKSLNYDIKLLEEPNVFEAINAVNNLLHNIINKTDTVICGSFEEVYKKVNKITKNEELYKFLLSIIIDEEIIFMCQNS